MFKNNLKRQNSNLKRQTKLLTPVDKFDYQIPFLAWNLILKKNEYMVDFYISFDEYHISV